MSEMTRRDALVCVGALVAGHVGERQEKQENTTTGVWFKQPKTSLSFGLDGYTEYIFTLGDRRVAVTPGQIMDALTHEHRPERWGKDAAFLVGARTLEVCADCGQTYWPEERT